MWGDQQLLEVARFVQRTQRVDADEIWFDPFSVSGVWTVPAWDLEPFARTPRPRETPFEPPGKDIVWGVLPMELLRFDRRTDSIDAMLAAAKEDAWPGLILPGADDEVLAAIAGLEGLRFLCLLQARGVTAEGLRKLAGLDLRHFVFDGFQGSDEIVRAITQWENLESAALPGRDVTDAGLAALSSMHHLRSLSLSNAEVTDAGVEALADLPLVSLGLSGCRQVTGATLGGFRALRDLDLAHSRVTPEMLPSLARQQTLTHLELSTHGWGTWEALADLGALEKLTHLQVSWAYPENLDFLRPLKRLRRVSLHSTRVAGHLGGLSGLKELEELALPDTRIVDEDLEPLAGCEALRALDLKSTSVTGAGLRHTPGLKRLNLFNCIRVTEDGLASVSALSKLEQLNVAHCVYPHEEEQSMGLTDPGLARLRETGALRRLSVEGNRVSPGAVAELREALPDCVIATSYLVPSAIVEATTAGTEALDSENLDAARAAFDDALAEDESYGPALVGLARVLSQRDDLAGALAAAERAVSTDPSAEHLTLQGRLLAQSEQPRSAVEVLTRALRADPDHLEGHFWRAEARYDAGDLLGAVSDYTSIIERCTAGESSAAVWGNWAAHLYTNRGSARLDGGDLQGAIADSDRAIALEPRWASAYTNRGEAREKSGSFEEAANDYSCAMVRDPGDAVPWKGRARCWIGMGKPDHAKSDLDEAAVRAPDDPEIVALRKQLEAS